MAAKNLPPPLIGNARSWTYTYNAQGQVKTITGPRSDVLDLTSYEYDAQGNLSRVTNSAGHVTQLLDYTADGDVGRIIDANNLVTILHYTPLRQIESIEVSDGTNSQRTSYRYHKTGKLAEITQADGSKQIYEYDAAQRLTRISDGSNHFIAYSYDSRSQLLTDEVHDSKGTLLQHTQRSYDALKRVQQIIHGNPEGQDDQGYSENYEYNAGGHMTKVSAQQQVTEFRYDILMQLSQILLPKANTKDSQKNINYSFDGRGQLRRIADPRSLATLYETDGLGNLNKLTSPDTGITTSEADLAGNMSKRTDARNISADYSYDSLNRLTQIKWPSTTLQFEYDIGNNAKGRLDKVTDPSGNTSWQYDTFGRVVQKTQTITPANQVLKQSMVYGKANAANGKLISFTYPSGVVISYSYGTDGKLENLSLKNKDGSITPLLKQTNFRPFGPVQSWQWGNHSSTNQNTYARGYDLAGRLKSYPLGHPLTSGGKQAAWQWNSPAGSLSSSARSISLTGKTGSAENDSTGGVQRLLIYDKNNRIVEYFHIGQGNTALFDQKFSYDGMGRLINASSSANGQSLGYQYDANGNRSLLQIGAQSYVHSIAYNNNRIDKTTGPGPAKTYQYDAMGNIIADGSINFSYTETGRLQRADRGSIASNYHYNALGQRVLKQTSPAAPNLNNISYAYDDAGHVIGEYDAQGKPIAETVYLGDMPVAVIKPQAANPNKTALYYIYADHLNTPRVITRSEGNQVVWRWTQLDPFGAMLPEENPSGLGEFNYNLRFPGQVYDAENGLHQNYFRDYDAANGRYLQSDPIGLRGGINAYGYVGGNPLSYVDVLGLAKGDWKNRPMDPNGVGCKNLGLKIDNLKAEVRRQIENLATNPQNLPYYAPGLSGPGGALSASVWGHEQLLGKYRQYLQNNVDQFFDRCSGPPPGPPTAPVTDNCPPQNRSSAPTWLKVLGGGAAVVGIGICIAAEPCGAILGGSAAIGGLGAVAAQ